ncbi:MAG: DMT family transporter [Chloroflexota bacterium]
MKNLSTNFLLLVPGTVWGLSFSVIELILPVVPPITITLVRSIISVIVLLSLLWYVGGNLPKAWSEWRPFYFLAAVNLAVPFALSTWGQVYIEGGLASILLSVMPLFTAIIAFWVLPDERLTPMKIMGISLGLVGIVILIGPDALRGVGGHVLAQIATVGAALLYAIGAVYIRSVFPRQPQHLSPWAMRLRIITAQFIAACVLLMPFSLLLETPWTLQPSLTIWLYLLFLGVGVTLLATMIYFYLIEKLGAGRASMTIYLIPVAGVISGAVILGEQLTNQMLLALVLILSGVFMANR